MNEKGKVLEAQGSYDAENRNVIVQTRNNKLGQQWEILYVDASKPDPTKGLYTDFGLYINRPFYIQTHLRSRRYLDLISNNLVIKTKNGRKS